MLINIEPLKKYPQFRYLFIGQMVSFLGSMISYVALPYQVYELTKDNSLVGLIGLTQFVPVLIFGLLGGTFADRLNRRKLLMYSEILMSFLVFGLMLNAFQEKPSIAVIFGIVAFMQSVLGFHRPAMEAMTQVLVDPKDYASIGALSSFRYSFGAIAGPALAGLIIAKFGVKIAFAVDVATYVVAVFCIYLLAPMADPVKSDKSALADAKEGLKFAVSKPELIGTYLIDIVAMIFAFPTALFPAMSEIWGGAAAAGVLFSAMATGSLIMTLFSGWTAKITSHGKGVVIAAGIWAVGIVLVGFSNSLWMAFLFLALAGGADMISAIFRGVIWNRTVPNQLRGRLSGIEMISYMSGPLLGNARAGWVASQFSVKFSLYSGGLICFVAVIITALFLPKFWKYQG